jgi:hypothetical protein
MDKWTTAWRLGVAVAAIYGPFVIVGLFVLASVDCAHCRETFWTLLPIEPGLVLSHFGLRAIPGFSAPGGFAYLLAGVISLAHVAMLSFAILKAKRPTIWFGCAFIFYFGLAVATIIMIRA